jgi:poly-gamma-glutamate synthesis protein (capsule biosynthesis protein)
MPNSSRRDVTILVAGDLCPAGRPEQVLARNEPYAVWGELAATLNAHDLKVVDLECPLTPIDDPIAKSGPHLRSQPGCANAIRSGGFDVVSLANNHIMDHGEQGLADTLQACRGAGLRTVGAGMDLEEAQEPVIAEIRGCRLALLAFTEREFSIATESRAGACPLDLPLNFGQLQRARARADTVIVLLHGGNEHQAVPSPEMVKTCRFFVDAGADAVVCCHAHIASGSEVYRDAPIVYGLGNFLFDWPSKQPKGWYLGNLASLRVDCGGVVALELTPYRQCVEAPVIELETGDRVASRRADSDELSRIVASPKLLETAWSAFCANRRVEYLTLLMSLTRLERGALKRGVWPVWRTRQARLYALLDVLTCEAHREAAMSILQAELEGRQRLHSTAARTRDSRAVE